MTATLHMTKVAAGCGTVDMLRRRQAGRAANGIVPIVTRYRPTRHEELIGGSLFWIIKHRLTVRQRIVGFGDSGDGRCRIDLDARIVPSAPARSARIRAGVISKPKTRRSISKAAPTCSPKCRPRCSTISPGSA